MKSRMIVMVLIIGFLTGCGNRAKDTSQPNDALREKYVYQAEYLDFNVREAAQFQGVDMCCISGDTAFFMGTCLTDETEAAVNELTGEPLIDEETGEPCEVQKSEAALFRMDLETGEVVRVGTYHPAEPPEGMLGSAFPVSMAAGLEGGFWIMESMHVYSYDLPEDFDGQNDQAWKYYVEGGYYKTLSQYGADGQLVKTLYISGLDDVDPYQILFDSEENIYISDITAGWIYVLNAEGVLLAQMPGRLIRQIGPSEFGILSFDPATGLSSFQRIDLETKSYGVKTELTPGTKDVYPGFGAYQYLYEDSANNVYGCKASGETEKLFSWLDCDVDRNTFSDFTVLPDGDLAAITVDFTQNITGEYVTHYGVLMMRQADPSALPQKQELTLACINLSPDIRSAVISFNQANERVRIVVKDYAEYQTSGDSSAGLTRLNTEILSGIVPDMICTKGLPVEQYAANGLLTDLWMLIDSDEGFSREDLMEHLFDVMSTNGKLYQITSSFTVWTAVGNASVIGERIGWTLEEMLEMTKYMPDDAAIFGASSTKNEILSLCVSRNLEHFLDWEEQTCSFDSPEFAEILNFANSFPAKDDGASSETAYDRFMTGRQLLMPALIGTFDSMQLLSATVGGDPCYVGFPSSYGSGNVFHITNGLAMTASCENKELAWSFLRTFLTEDYQTANDLGLASFSSNYGFPTNRHAFDTLVERQRQTRASAKYAAELDGLRVIYEPMSQENYDTFLRLYESCNRVDSENNIVYSIIEQETAPFFDGLKTIEDVVELIQNRVSLYMMEQK